MKKHPFYQCFLLINFIVFQACAQPSFETMEPDEFEKALAEGANMQLVDVGTKQEFVSAHLENAIHFDINGPEFNNMASFLSKTVPIYVCCLSACRSKNAANWFVDHGFTKSCEFARMYCGLGSGKQKTTNKQYKYRRQNSRGTICQPYQLRYLSASKHKCQTVTSMPKNETCSTGIAAL